MGEHEYEIVIRGATLFVLRMRTPVLQRGMGLCHWWGVFRVPETSASKQIHNHINRHVQNPVSGMKMTKILSACMVCILAGLLAVAGCTDTEPDLPDAIPPAGTPDISPGTWAVWKDTCSLFASGNESEYNAVLAEAMAGVAENQTGIADFSNQSWSEAFRSVNTLMKERYAFIEWRAVDFDALSREYAPQIAQAEEEQDEAAYYRALREYLCAIPDGHVDVIPLSGDYGAREADIGGSYGIGIIGLDSGTVIVSHVADGSAADAAGVRFGDEVLAWNGVDIHDAINETSYIWATKKPSTTEGIRLHQERLLTRGPVGATATISLAGASDAGAGSSSGSRTVHLTAFDDGYDDLKKTSVFLGTAVNDYGVDRPWSDVLPQISNTTVTSRMLPGGYAYIAVYEESFGVCDLFQAAMREAIAGSAPGIVLDFRFNNGGDDAMAACMASWFVDEPVFYEYATTYDPGTGTVPIVFEAWSSPRPEGYRGPVAVLVSPDTISSGEGVPMMLSKTGRGKVISWYGTNGAFGIENIQAVMPPDMYILFPDGASLNETGGIQVDSDATMTGGVAPDIRVPLTEETVARAMNGEDVQLTYALEWLAEQQ